MQSDKAAASVEQQIIQLEREALKRWCEGDPSGFLEISAPTLSTSIRSWNNGLMDSAL
jgi:hypothetical protein